MKVQLLDEQDSQAILNDVDPTYRQFLLQQKSESIQKQGPFALILEGSYTPSVKVEENTENALIQATIKYIV